MKIGITSDHGGYNLKTKLIKYLKNKYEVVDYGTYGLESVDYPDFAFKLGEAIVNEDISFGIAICKTGIGISIALNKVKGIRCAKLDNIKDVGCSRKHNNANAISISGNMNFYKAKMIINRFLNTEFSNDERHVRRINKIKEYENEH